MPWQESRAELPRTKRSVRDGPRRWQRRSLRSRSRDHCSRNLLWRDGAPFCTPSRAAHPWPPVRSGVPPALRPPGRPVSRLALAGIVFCLFGRELLRFGCRETALQRGAVDRPQLSGASHLLQCPAAWHPCHAAGKEARTGRASFWPTCVCSWGRHDRGDSPEHSMICCILAGTARKLRLDWAEFGSGLEKGVSRLSGSLSKACVNAISGALPRTPCTTSC